MQHMSYSSNGIQNTDVSGSTNALTSLQRILRDLAQADSANTIPWNAGLATKRNSTVAHRYVRPRSIGQVHEWTTLDLPRKMISRQSCRMLAFMALRGLHVMRIEPWYLI